MEISESVQQNNNQPLVVILTGPSGVGKDAALNELKKSERPWHYVVTATTRPRRHNETDGVDYIFMDEAEFRTALENNEFLESANVKYCSPDSIFVNLTTTAYFKSIFDIL